jgi:DNA-binding transcriptional MerR regulator
MNTCEPQPYEELLDIDQFSQKQFTPFIPLEKCGVDKAVLAFWRREGLLPFIPKGKWAHLSYMQVLWLQVLNSVRDLGLPVQRLKDLNTYFIQRAYDDDLPRKHMLYNQELLESKAKKTPLTLEDLNTLAQIKMMLGSEIILWQYRFDVNYFSNLVMESLREKKEGGILIFPEFIVEYVHSGYRVFPDRTVDLQEPHVNIPLQPFLRRFIKSEDLSPFQPFIAFPRPEELQVWQAIRDRSIKRIEITKSDGGRRLRIDTTKTGLITVEQATEIKRILDISNYESITLDTLDQTTLSFKRTKKKNVDGL